jgi:hypothetical protein
MRFAVHNHCANDHHRLQLRDNYAPYCDLWNCREYAKGAVTATHTLPPHDLKLVDESACPFCQNTEYDIRFIRRILKQKIGVKMGLGLGKEDIGFELYGFSIM